jgi:hypothetical protein
MLAALVAGERDPVVLAELAKGPLRRKIPALRHALQGRFNEHHALMIGMALEHTSYLEASIARLDEAVDALFAARTREDGVPFNRARDHLATITGVGKRAAETIIAEIGVDMTRFPPRRTWRPGPDSHRATTSPAASAAQARPPKATSGWSRYSTNAPGPPPTPATPTSPPSSGGWPAGSARRRPPPRSPTPSW